ncbi:YheV family putative zinc ribbon protein [Saccharospirillum sp.]|uniref:YheV family putative zinc ribbon protein n=1 Tax=Saccharospirillum sp. TaxID=2033801 RepID=UPI0034A06B78
MTVRFIAGAVCPKCGTMDTLKAGYEHEGAVMVRECVDCGYIDRISQTHQSLNEIKTRVTPPPAEPDVEATPVKIIDPTLPAKDDTQ